ncbi:hypothetical protein Tsubulata_007888 [Turnera subulata]|uniref:Phytocyanin domain-containing protein n=1 Tax=Turnera subulata TaxID=218843 RepID=A0A9Q0FPQ6_9ROSI|nr:hypothetical protein Tsubulata_007888 [Turnera subulata]
MARFVAMAFGLFVAALLQCAAAQTVHIVGDSIGWSVPQGGAQAYSNWANGKSFAIGDILQFNFNTNEHDVQQVPKASFEACTQSNTIGSMITTGPANITLDSAGEHYYICTIGRHCQFGQKLAITVSSTPGGVIPPSTTPTPTSPITPSPASGIPADCAPTPASSPAAAGGPSSSRVPGAANPAVSPLPGSSSSNLLASVLVSMLAISMGLFI